MGGVRESVSTLELVADFRKLSRVMDGGTETTEFGFF